MTTWIAAADGAQQYPHPTDATVGFPKHARPASLHIERTTGDVQLQRLNSAGSWVTFATRTDAEQTVQIANQPSLRILATGDARFKFTWGA